jgi:hypothetical protein
MILEGVIDLATFKKKFIFIFLFLMNKYVNGVLNRLIKLMIYIVEAHVSIYHGSWLVMDIPKHLTWISDPTILTVKQLLYTCLFWSIQTKSNATTSHALQKLEQTWTLSSKGKQYMVWIAGKYSYVAGDCRRAIALF